MGLRSSVSTGGGPGVVVGVGLGKVGWGEGVLEEGEVGERGSPASLGRGGFLVTSRPVALFTFLGLSV